jgi:rhomboid protease GluP
MTNFILKLRLIFWPFLRLLLLVPAAYAGFCWLISTMLDTPLEGEVKSDFWLLGLVGGVAVLVGLRPRIHLLQSRGDGRWRALFYFPAVISLGIATSAATTALQAITRRLVPLNHIGELPGCPATNTAFEVRNFYLARSHTTMEKKYATVKSGVELTLYFATPLFRTAADTVSRQPVAWLGTIVTKFGRATTSNSQYTELYKFAEATKAQLPLSNLTDFFYLVRASPTPGLLAAIRQSPWADTLAASPILVKAVHEPFARRATVALHVLGQTLLIGPALFLGLLLFPQLNLRFVHRYQRTGALPTDEDAGLLWIKAKLHFLRPRPGFRLTPMLFIVNLLLFFSLVLGESVITQIDATYLVGWGASPDVAEHVAEWCWLLLSPLLHVTVLPLIANMVALLYAGWVLERVTGGRVLALVFGTAALTGSLASWWWQPAALNVGAAGGTLGLYSFGVALLLGSKAVTRPLTREWFYTGAMVFLGLSLLFGFQELAVTNVSQVGGLVAGGLLGLGLRGRLALRWQLSDSIGSLGK